MELKEFISKALQDIIFGVEDAQSKVENGSVASGAIIKPDAYSEKHLPEESAISFDIAVTAEDTVSSEAGGKISVFSIGASGNASKETSVSTVSRIQFSVKIKYPRKK